MRYARLLLLVLLVFALASSASTGHIRKGINELSLRVSFDVVSAAGITKKAGQIKGYVIFLPDLPASSPEGGMQRGKK